MNNNSNTDLNKLFLSSLPVVDSEGNLIESKDYTQTESSLAPLKYSDGRLVKENDYVLHINYQSEIPVHADFAQVWATLYYDNGQPIGVSLNKANDNKSPTISMFSMTDGQGNEKRYYKTAITISQADIENRILFLGAIDGADTNFNEQWFRSRVTELSEEYGIASFALYMWLKDSNSTKANEYLEKSANQSYKYAKKLLEHNKNKVYEELSIDVLTQRANSGDELAQYNLAKSYILGKNLEQNDEKAIFWLEKVSKTNLQAYLDLGRYYRYGSFDWFRKEKMLFNTSYFPSGEQAIKTFECFQFLSEKEWSGQISARFQLAECISYGIGVNADPSKGLKMYASIINEGDIDANIEVEESLYRYSEYKIRQSDLHFQRNEVELAIELFEEGYKHLSACASGYYSPAKLEIAEILLQGRPLRLKQNRKTAFQLLHGINIEELTPSSQENVKELLANEEVIMAQPAIDNENYTITEGKKNNINHNNHETIINKKFGLTIIILIIVFFYVCFK